MPNIQTYDQFLSALADKESRGKGEYQAETESGTFIGKYQLGTVALSFTGYKIDGKWTGKNGVNSKQNFKDNKVAQEDAVSLWIDQLQREIDNFGLSKSLGETIAGVKITQYGLLGGAHLVGSPKLNRFVKSNGFYIPEDGNQTPVTSYIRDLAVGVGSLQTNSRVRRFQFLWRSLACLMVS